jgi:hypothetical protein
VFNKLTLAALATGALVAATGAQAVGDSQDALDFQLGMQTQIPARPTALTLHVVYRNPSDPNAKPSPLRKSVIEAPAGTIFNGRAIPVCTASDIQLMVSGTAACPAGSQVGGGTVSLITGFGSPVDPVIVDAVLLNRGDGIVELFSEHRTDVRLAVGHAKFTAPNTLTETPAPNPGGPPDGESAVHQVDFRFYELRGADGEAFITTPPTCPGGGAWIARITATLANGETLAAQSSTPCAVTTTPATPIKTTRPNRTGITPAMRLTVMPRRAIAGARTRFRIQLRSSARRCVRGVTIHVYRVRGQTDGHGRAIVITRFPRRGSYVVSADEPGCRTARSTIEVRDRSVAG